jgi:CRISPR system Cascade subunit CasA
MTYSLLAEPWLQLITTDGSHQQGSLREALLEPSRWAGLDSAHPLQCLALYRLLLAISHRAIGPADTSDDRAALLDNWPADQVAAYLNRWSNRFALFDADRPFMQNPT